MGQLRNGTLAVVVLAVSSVTVWAQPESRSTRVARPMPPTAQNFNAVKETAPVVTEVVAAEVPTVEAAPVAVTAEPTPIAPVAISPVVESTEPKVESTSTSMSTTEAVAEPEAAVVESSTLTFDVISPVVEAVETVETTETVTAISSVETSTSTPVRSGLEPPTTENVVEVVAPAEEPEVAWVPPPPPRRR